MMTVVFAAQDHGAQVLCRVLQIAKRRCCSAECSVECSAAECRAHVQSAALQSAERKCRVQRITALKCAAEPAGPAACKLQVWPAVDFALLLSMRMLALMQLAAPACR